MSKMRMAGTIFSMVVGLIVLSGCKASPAKKQTKFLGDEHRMAKDPSVEAYHRVWIDASVPDKKWESFKKIYFAPVNTDYVRNMEWWNKVDTSYAKKETLKDLAKYMRKEFIKAHQKNPEQTLQVVDKPDKNTLIVELAITEVVPTKVWLNLASYALIWMALDQGTIAMEGRVRDGGTNKVVAQFMDRESGKANIVNIKDLTWYSHAKSIITEWAEQSVELVNADDDDVVKDSCPFTLLPW